MVIRVEPERMTSGSLLTQVAHLSARDAARGADGRAGQETNGAGMHRDRGHDVSRDPPAECNASIATEPST